MKIAAYIHPSRTAITPTGVGKHMIQMIMQLTRQPDMDVKLMTSRRELTDGHIDRRSPLAHLPALGHPLSRATMERLWLLTGHPIADRWAGEADWVYCPAEAYVPLKRARFAATIHCVNWFDPELPWYDDPATRTARRRMELRWKTILQRSDVVLTVSQFLKDRITALFGTDPKRMAVVGNGVEEEFFVAGEKSGPTEFGRDRYILIVGGLTQRKGANYVFPVAEQLLKRDPTMQIRVAGSGESRFEEQAKAHPNIVHIGYQGTDALPALMRESVAVMFLSRYETFGIPAAEAMAAGAPSVVANFAALPEVVADGGLVVDVNRPDQIAETLVRLAEDREFREPLVERGKRRAQAFHWSAAAERLMAALREPR
jgi:glycosyltransferase involved in cell wall biosynthesis